MHQIEMYEDDEKSLETVDIAKSTDVSPVKFNQGAMGGGSS